MRLKRNFLKRNRRWLVSVAAVLFVLFGYAYQWKWSHRPLRHEFTTQRPGEPRRTWRRMRTAWEFQPGPAGAPWTVNDFFGNEERLYYVCDCEAGCLDPASGRALWRFPFLSLDMARGGQQNAPADRSWRLFPDTDRLYAYESHTSNTASYDAFHVYALNPQTGKVLWSTQFLTPFAGPLCVAGPLLLLTDVDGTIKALRRQDGALVWQQRFAAKRYPLNGADASLNLAVADGCGVLQVGAGHLLAFRIGDGSLLWSLPAAPKGARAAEEGSADTPVVDKGVAYTVLKDNTIVAVALRTGHFLWKRHTELSGTQAGYVSGAQGRVLCSFSEKLAGLETQSGKTAWIKDYSSDSANSSALSVVTDTTLGPGPNAFPVPHTILYIQDNCDALVGQQQHLLRSVTTMNTLIAIESATGQERWRWQPTHDMNFDSIVVGRHRLYLAEKAALSAIEDGEAEPLPDTPHGRSMLSRRLLYQQYKWPPPNEDLLQLWMRLMASNRSFHMRGGGRGSNAGGGNAGEAPDEDEAELALLEMGADSVQPLLEFIAHAVHEQETKPVPAGSTRGRGDPPESFINVLDLLFDKEDPRIVTALAAQLERSTYPGTRMALAETLIRLGDVRALRALFRYAQSPAAQPDAREDALYYVCRHSVPSNASPYSAGLPPDAPTQQEVTDWLLLRLADHKTPAWLRVLVKFELLRDRGEKARKAALATFHLERQVRFRPTNLVLHSTPPASGDITGRRNGIRARFRLSRSSGWGWNEQPDEFPREIESAAIAREDNQGASGRVWIAFKCAYLAPGEELWFAQSQTAGPTAKNTGGTTSKAKKAANGKQNRSVSNTGIGNEKESERKKKRFFQFATKQKQGRYWSKAVFGVNLSAQCRHGGYPDRIRLAYAHKALALTWDEVSEPVMNRKNERFVHRQTFPIADLYRDSDGDGLTDLAEKELGLNPYRADSNGNGIPDGSDKNPFYKLHKLNEQEQIYQAVLEALCQLGRSFPSSEPGYDIERPTPFGCTSVPIRLPAPPGSSGVEIRGHTGMVLCGPQSQCPSFLKTRAAQAAGWWQFHFIPPHIGLDGTWRGHHDPTQPDQSLSRDPFAPKEAERSALKRAFVFKDYFPVVLSRSGTRARIGFVPDRVEQTGFDIEVRKIEGQWLPVECRRVYCTGRHYSDIAVNPVRDRQDKSQMEYNGRTGY